MPLYVRLLLHLFFGAPVDESYGRNGCLWGKGGQDNESLTAQLQEILLILRFLVREEQGSIIASYLHVDAVWCCILIHIWLADCKAQHSTCISQHNTERHPPSTSLLRSWTGTSVYLTSPWMELPAAPWSHFTGCLFKGESGQR